MEIFLNKDILGIIVMKLDVKSVVMLACSCKKIREIVPKFNKYWFVQYFDTLPDPKLRDQLSLNKSFSEWFTHAISFKDYKDLRYTFCICPEEFQEGREGFRVMSEQLRNEFQNSSLFPKNSNDEIELGYARMKFLQNKFPDHKCLNRLCYLDRKKYDLTSINILSAKMLELYDPDIVYFNNFIINQK